MSLYLELLRDVLLNKHYGDAAAPLSIGQVLQLKTRLNSEFADWLTENDTPAAERVREILALNAGEFARWLRGNARLALALQPVTGLDNVIAAARTALTEGIPGDFCEAGVWKGACTILMRAVLKEAQIPDRKVWSLDSFQGLPVPDRYENPLDYLSYEGLRLIGGLAVGLDEVKANFAKFGLLDEQVNFVAGWFHETLPGMDIPPIAVLRLDADFYESTVPLLRYLYPKVSPGGFVIIDDYGIPNMEARRAVDEYRSAHGITAELHPVNEQTVYWRK